MLVPGAPPGQVRYTASFAVVAANGWCGEYRARLDGQRPGHSLANRQPAKLRPLKPIAKFPKKAPISLRSNSRQLSCFLTCAANGGGGADALAALHFDAKDVMVAHVADSVIDNGLSSLKSAALYLEHKKKAPAERAG